MNIVLTHCWKEWRAQRGVVLGYAGLVVACLCLVFSSMPETWWHSSHRGAIALSWFVAAGMLGVLLFVAPGLVRCEFAAKDDQFVRRLPGALGASCGGKVLFLALATVVLPLVGLACGELFLSVMGRPHDQFVLFGSLVGEEGLHAQWPTIVCGYALLVAPWVWAVGTWLPRGRMALGGVVLLGAVLGFAAAIVFQQNPQIEKGLRWEPWLWYVSPTGLLVAVVSWTVRRGGGALRSAKFGAMAFAIVAVPPAGWLGGEVWRYHHPDPHRFEDQFFAVSGITPDLRFALAHGKEDQHWPSAPFRIDLTNGDVQQIGATSRNFTPELHRPTLAAWRGTLRFWRSFDGDLANNELFDLTTGVRTPIEGRIVNEQGPRWSPVLPADLALLVQEERRAATPLRAPGGRRVWFDGKLLRFEGAEDMPWPNGDPWPVLLQPAGHGFLWMSNDQKPTFDLAARRPGRKLEHGQWCWFVRGSCVVSDSKRHWLFRDPDGPGTQCAALQGAHVLGLFDDERLLCAGSAAQSRQPVFLFDVATETVQDVPLPVDVGLRQISVVSPMDQAASLLARDPAGRIWLRAAIDAPDNRGNLRQTFILLDTNTLTTRTILPDTRYCRDSYDLLGWPDARTVLMKRGARILRIDIETLAETVLFPRE